jgi:hypothetical protein
MAVSPEEFAALVEEAGADETTTTKRVPLGLEEEDTKAAYSRLRSRYGPYASQAGGQIYYSRDITAGSRWTASTRTDWQLKLIAAGLLSKNSVSLGVWDKPTQAAYQEVLELANQSGLTKEEALAQFVEGAAASAAAGFGPDGPEAPVIQLTAPGDLRESFRKTYRERVGKNPSEAALAAFVDRFHSLEAGGQKTYNDAAPGSTVTAAPDTTTVALEQLRGGADAAEEHAYQAITRMQDFFSMLDSPVQ